MKILSWNINGMRAVLKKGFLDFLKKEKPDVLCLQEIKITKAAWDKELGGTMDPAKIGYEVFLNPAQRPGYSGTAMLVKKTFVETPRWGVSTKVWDNEGRIQIIDLEKFYLVNVYFPNSNHELSRLDFKIDFNDKLLKIAKDLERRKPAIITGDFNVAHNEIDLARPKENIGSPGFHPREREWMTKFLQAGFKDTFRELHPDKVQYTWWSYRAGARRKDIGWRIDYFCVSDKLMENIKDSFIQSGVLGSDHCPVGIVLQS